MLLLLFHPLSHDYLPIYLFQDVLPWEDMGRSGGPSNRRIHKACLDQVSEYARHRRIQGDILHWRTQIASTVKAHHNPRHYSGWAFILLSRLVVPSLAVLQPQFGPLSTPPRVTAVGRGVQRSLPFWSAPSPLSPPPSLSAQHHCRLFVVDFPLFSLLPTRGQCASPVVSYGALRAHGGTWRHD